MKRNICKILMFFLFMTTAVSLFFAAKYKLQTDKLNKKVQSLNLTLSQMNSEKESLSINKKSTKPESELISIEVQECMKKCNYTTACMNNCTYDSADKWQAEISKNIKLLDEIMNKEQKNLLKESQQKWLEYKKAQQTLNLNTIGQMQGTMFTNILAGEQVYILELRAKELSGLYSIYSEQ